MFRYSCFDWCIYLSYNCLFQVWRTLSFSQGSWCCQLVSIPRNKDEFKFKFPWLWVWRLEFSGFALWKKTNRKEWTIRVLMIKPHYILKYLVTFQYIYGPMTSFRFRQHLVNNGNYIIYKKQTEVPKLQSYKPCLRLRLTSGSLYQWFIHTLN
jgi:hypothetical protein